MNANFEDLTLVGQSELPSDPLRRFSLCSASAVGSRKAGMLAVLLGGFLSGTTRAELDQFYETPDVFGNTIVAARFEGAQTFRVGHNGLLSSVEVNIGRFPFSINDDIPLTLDIRRTINGVPVETNSGPDVLSSLTKLAVEIPYTNGADTTFISFDFPDVPVTIGDQLAIVLRTPAGAVFGARDDGPFAWASDMTGGYALGQAFARGVDAPALSWGNGDSFLRNMDHEFRTYVVPEPTMILLSGIAFLAARRERLSR